MLISNLNREKSDFDAKMRSINDLLQYIEADDDTRSRIQDFYDYKLAVKEGPAEILNELPPALAVKITRQRWGPILDKVPFFAGLDDRLLFRLCKRIGTCLINCV